MSITVYFIQRLSSQFCSYFNKALFVCFYYTMVLTNFVVRTVTLHRIMDKLWCPKNGLIARQSSLQGGVVGML